MQEAQDGSSRQQTDTGLAEIEFALESARQALEHELSQLEPEEEVLPPEEAARLLDAKRPQHGARGSSLYAQSKAEAVREVSHLQTSSERSSNATKRLHVFFAMTASRNREEHGAHYAGRRHRPVGKEDPLP